MGIVVPLSACILLPKQCPEEDADISNLLNATMDSALTERTPSSNSPSNYQALSELRKHKQFFADHDEFGILQMRTGYIMCVGSTFSLYFIAVQVH
jgi:hypothetical protein